MRPAGVAVEPPEPPPMGANATCWPAATGLFVNNEVAHLASSLSLSLSLSLFGSLYLSLSLSSVAGQRHHPPTRPITTHHPPAKTPWLAPCERFNVLALRLFMNEMGGVAICGHWALDVGWDSGSSIQRTSAYCQCGSHPHWDTVWFPRSPNVAINI